MSEENTTETNRKPNPNNIPQPGDDSQKKKPRFNIYWVYGILFAGLIVWNLLRGVSIAGVETSEVNFYEMVKLGDVEKTKTVLNKYIVRVFLNKDSIAKHADFYKQIGRAHV